MNFSDAFVEYENVNGEEGGNGSREPTPFGRLTPRANDNRGPTPVDRSTPRGSPLPRTAAAAGGAGHAASPLPRTAAAAGGAGHAASPLPRAPPMTNVQRRSAQRAVQAARNEELRRIRAIVPQAYEENGIIVIPALAGRQLAAPVPRRAAVSAAVASRQPPAAAAHVLNDPVNTNNENPRPPVRENRRRRTKRNKRNRSSRKGRHASHN